MKGIPETTPATVPVTDAEWDVVAAARDRALTLPAAHLNVDDFPEVRPEIILSWKRSMLAGVDPEGDDFPLDADFTPNSRLARVAEPILKRLSHQIADLSSWGFLMDRASRLLTVVVGENPTYVNADFLDLKAGLCFGEDVIGTNGIGTARELQKPFLVSGTEHFRAPTSITTTGVNIFDPFTRRFMGTLGIHCRREYASAALLPLVGELGRSIENQLMVQRSDGEREIFEAFLRIRRRFPGAVMAVAQDLVLSNAAARQIFGPADGELIQSIAREASVRNREGSVVRILGNGRKVRFRTFPIDHPRGGFAAVLVLSEVAEQLGSVPNSTPSTPLLEDAIDQSLAASRPVLLSGERGTGKRHIAVRALGRAGYRDSVEVDCSTSALNGQEWLSSTAEAFSSGQAVVLTHIDETEPSMVPVVVGLIRGSAGPIVATRADQAEADPQTSMLQEIFPVVVEVLPLRDRFAELADICRSILGEFQIPSPSAGLDHVTSEMTTKALAALAKQDWPGNIRQLRQVLFTSAVRAGGMQIHEDHLPQHHRTSSAGGNLTLMERTERQALQSVLASCGGNRNAAAQQLGISRATIYRKLRRYQLH